MKYALIRYNPFGEMVEYEKDGFTVFEMHPSNVKLVGILTLDTTFPLGRLMIAERAWDALDGDMSRIQALFARHAQQRDLDMEYPEDIALNADIIASGHPNDRLISWVDDEERFMVITYLGVETSLILADDY